MSSLDERRMTAVLALVAVVGSFSVVMIMRRSPAAAQPTVKQQAVAPYSSKTGFVPFEYKRNSDHEYYVMLDVIPESGSRLRYIDVQIFENSKVFGNSWTYAQHRVDCENLDMVDYGDGDTLEILFSRQGENSLHYTPLPLTFQYAGANAACAHLRRL